MPSGITSLFISDSCNISFIPYSNVSSPTDLYSQSLTTQSTATDRKTNDSTWLSSLLYTRSTWPTSQTGGSPWMPALAESATFQTKSHARVADGKIQPAQYCTLFKKNIINTFSSNSSKQYPIFRMLEMFIETQFNLALLAALL